jgi:hypothetical protein
MNSTNMKMTELTQPNVMAENVMTSPPSTQATTATDQIAINVDLQKRLDFLDLTAIEMDPVRQDKEVAPFVKEAEEKRKMRAEKRLNARLRKLEIEQKAELLAEWQKSLKEARRKFEAQPQVPYDYIPGPPSCINDIFRAEKERNRLIALEREQKEELLRQVMEKRAREFGDEWPRIQEMSQDPRFDHIPKRWPGYEEIMAKAFPGPRTVQPKE